MNITYAEFDSKSVTIRQTEMSAHDFINRDKQFCAIAPRRRVYGVIAF